MLKLGAHLSIAGGHTKALEKIVQIGGNCLQIFSTSPRGWSRAKMTPEEIEQFITIKNKLKINPVYFHASYLINLADSSNTGRYSKASLIAEMNLAAQLGIKGSIIHLGSFKEGDRDEEISPEVRSRKYEILIKNIKEVLSHTPPNVLFIIENAATRKIGLTLDELSKIIKDVNDKRIRICFDTCHLHAAGYKLSTLEQFDNFLTIVNSFIGLEKLELWHLNDSKDPANSRRDRHENIGNGTIGLGTFRFILNHEKLKHLTFIIETPGFDEKGPDKDNLDILKNLITPEPTHVVTTPETV